MFDKTGHLSVFEAGSCYFTPPLPYLRNTNVNMLFIHLLALQFSDYDWHAVPSTVSSLLCHHHSTWQMHAPVHRSPVATPFATENKIIWFMFYTRNSARQPVQTRATTQQTPPHSAVSINADHLHKSELHTNYIRDRLAIQTKNPPRHKEQPDRHFIQLVF